MPTIISRNHFPPIISQTFKNVLKKVNDPNKILAFWLLFEKYSLYDLT